MPPIQVLQLENGSVAHQQSTSTVKYNLIVVVFAVTIGSSFGVYSTAVVNNLKPIIVHYLNESGAGMSIYHDPDTVWSIVVAAYPIGCGVGTLFSGFLAEIWGRKIGLLVSNAVNMLGGIMCLFYPKVFHLSISGRLLMGASLGLSLSQASSFITEIAPVKYRGACNAGLQAAFALGDVFGIVATLPQLLGTLALSHWALGFTACSSVFSFIVLLFSHESPRYLVLKMKNVERGIKALTFYQGRENVDLLLEEIRNEKQPVQRGSNKKMSILDRIRNAPVKQVLITWACFVLPVFSGVPIIMGYSTDAFIDNGISPQVAPYCSMSLGFCNLMSSITCMLLVERWGRRKVLITGVIGSFVGPCLFTIFSLVIVHTYVPSGFAYILVVCLMQYSFFYSFLNSSSMAIAPEVCSQSYRSYAVSIGSFLQTAASAMLILTYQPIKLAFGISWVFFLFSCIAFICGSFLFVFTPETANISLTDIKKRFAMKQ